MRRQINWVLGYLIGLALIFSVNQFISYESGVELSDPLSIMGFIIFSVFFTIYYANAWFDIEFMRN